MIFKTFDNDIDKISAKWGILGKSFNDIGTAMVGRISDINKGFQATDDLISSIKNSDSVWKRLYPNKETIQSQIINVETLFPKQTDEYFSSLLDDLSQQQNLINKTKGSWQDYFKNLGEGEEWQIEFVQNTDLQKASLNDIKKAYNSARAAQIAQNEALQQSTLSAKAATVATKALAAAGNMIVFTLISKGIELAVSAIDNYINRAKYAAEAMEEAQQRIDDAQNTLNNMSATISENKDRFLELSQGVDKFSQNLTLSEEDYAEYLSISNKLAAFSPSLVSAYDNQGNALLAIGSNAMETNEKLQSLLETQQTVAQQTLIDNMDDVANGIYYEVEDARNSIHDIEAELSSLQQQYNEFNIDISNSDGFINFNDEDYSKYGKAMEKALSSAGIKFRKNVSAGLYNTAIQLESASPQQLEQAQKFYDAWLASENEYYHASENGLKQDMAEKENFIDASYAKMTANLQAWVKNNYNYQYLSDSASAMVDALVPEIKWAELETPLMTGLDYQNYVEKNILKPLMEIPEEHKQEIDAMFQKLLSFDDGDLDVLDFAKQLQAKLNEYEIKINIMPVIANEQEAKNKLQNSIEYIAEGGHSDFTTSSGVHVDASDYKKLQEYTKDFSYEEIMIWDKATLGCKNATDAIRQYEKTLASISQNNDTTDSWDYSETITQLDTIKEKFSSLDKTYAKFFDDDASTNIGFEDFSSLNAAFKDLDGIDRYIQRLQEAGQNQEAVTEIMSDLAGAYINQTGILDNVNDQNAALIEQTLTEIGIEGAHELVTRQLAAAKEVAALQSFNLANATFADIQKLIEEEQVSDEAGNYLLTYALKKELANGTTLTTASDIENIKSLVLALGGAVNALERFQTVKNGLPVKLSNPNDKKIHTGNNSVYVEGTYDTTSYQDDAQKEIDDILNAPYHFPGGSTTNSTKSNPSNAGSGNSNAGSGGSSTPTETSQTFDWIETRLDVLAEKTSNLGDTFSNAYGIDAKNEAYLTYLSAIQEEIDANTTAIAYYEQRLNEIGLSYEWIAKIQSGAFDISTITDPALIDQIQQYQSFYEKIQGYQNTVQSLEQQRQKAQADHAKDVVDTYDQEIESFQKIIDKQKAFVSLKELFGGSASKKDLETQQNAVSRQINRIEEQNRGLDQLIRTTTYGSEAWQIYHDKIEENKDSILDFTQSLAELAKEIANLPLDTLDAKLEKISQKKEKYDAKIANATSAKEQNKLINQQMRLTKKENKQTQKAAEKTKENLSLSIKNFSSAKQTDKKYVSADQQKKIDSYYKQIKTYTKSKKQIPPSLITKLSEEGHSYLAQACVNYNAALEANNTAQATAALTAETTKTKLAELAKEKFDNVQTEYERKQSQINHKADTVNTKMELASAKGYLESENWYEQLISYEQQQQNSLQAEATALQNRLDKAMASGNIEKYSDEWWEMTEAIQSVNESLEQGEITLQEYQNQLEQIKANNFDFLQQQISRLTSESDFFIDLMADKDLTDDNGLTDYGTATLGLHYQNYDTYLAQAEKYGEEIARINGQLANDPYNTTLLSQLQEREDAQRDCILAAEEEKNAVVDLKKQGYDALANSLSNVISKYKESLRSAKDAHDYQKNIAKQSENINSLQRKITAYTTLSGNEEIAAKLQQANKELSEAQENLEETMYDKYISDTEDILDDLLDELESYIEELISSVDSEFATTRETVNQNADEIKSTLDGLSASYDISLSSAVKEIWKDGYTPEKGFTAILDKMDKLITASDAQADQQADQDTPQEPDTNQDAVFQEVLSDQDITFSGAKSKEPHFEALTDRNPDLMSAAKSDQTSAISRHDKIVPSLAISEFSLATLEENLPPMSQLFNSTLPVYQDRTSHPNTLGGNVSISFGDLTLPDVTDSAEFAATVEKTMRNAICSNGRTTKCLTEAVASQMTGSGIGKANLYR